MNKYIVFFVILFSIFSCKPNIDEPIKVSTIKTTYIINSGKEIKHRVEYYDTLGNCIKEIIFGSNSGDTVSIIENSFAVTLQLQSVEKNRSGEIQQTTINHYENTNLNEKIIIRNNDTMLIQNYTYHDNGNLKREVIQFPQGKVTPVINVRNYDIKGNPETIFDQIYVDSSMKVLGRYEMTSFNNTYDENTNRLSKVIATKLLGYYEETDTLFEKRYSYDDLGNIIKEYYPIKLTEEVPDSINYIYSDTGLLKNKISYYTTIKQSQPELQSDTIYYQYDTFERLIKEYSDFSGYGYRIEYSN